MSLVPYVVEQTARGERSYDIFSRLLNDRIIVLSEDVNPTSASVIIAQLLYLEGQDPEKDISFYINSPGGSISDGMAIHDTMQYIKFDFRERRKGTRTDLQLLRPFAKAGRTADHRPRRQYLQRLHRYVLQRPV